MAQAANSLGMAALDVAAPEVGIPLQVAQTVANSPEANKTIQVGVKSFFSVYKYAIIAFAVFCIVVVLAFAIGIPLSSSSSRKKKEDGSKSKK